MAVRVGLSSYPPVPVVAGSKWPDICGKLRPQIQANELLSTHTINVERVSQENADAEKQAGRRKGGIVWTLTVARSTRMHGVSAILRAKNAVPVYKFAQTPSRITL